MNNIYAREPVFNLKKQLFAYQFVYRNQTNGAYPIDMSTLSVNNEPIHGLSIDELLQVGKTIVNLNIDEIDIFREHFSPDDVIVEVSGITAQPSFRETFKIESLKKAGFEIVISLYHAQLPELLTIANYVKCEVLHTTPSEIRELKAKLVNKNAKIIATQVHSYFQFEQCQSLGIDYVQGFFFLEPATNTNKPAPTSKLANMQLMMEMAKSELDVKNLQHVFETDPTLSFMLMKFINNPLVNKSYKITSIRHALNYLGELMVRRFVAIVSLASLNSDKPNELLNLSLSRAKFCELVDAECEGSADAMSAFLVGLFSLLDVILDKPLRVLIEGLGLDDKIEQALIHKQGHLYGVLACVRAIETGDWNELIASGNRLSLTQDFMIETHREAMRWQYDMTKAVSPCFPVTSPGYT